MAGIQFFSQGQMRSSNGRLESDSASTRYRVAIPATQLSRRRHSINIGYIPFEANGPVDPNIVKDNIVVFSKCIAPAALQLMQEMRKRGKFVVCDLCDDYFNHVNIGAQHRDLTIDMCKAASQVVASTPRLADIIRENTGIEARVITDPVEGDRQLPSFEPRFPRVKLLWFGIHLNFPSLAAIIPSLAELHKTLPIELKIITSIHRDVPRFIDKLKQEGEPFPIVIEPWTIDAVAPALAACDIVIIPSGEADFLAAKSPNRIAESIWAGKHVVANPVPSYEAFREFAWIGDDIARGIRESLEQVKEIPARIAMGQAYVQKNHSPYVIGEAWENLLGIAPAQRSLRLNLGCGDKILPGYVNVDVVASRAGQKPDVLCDLHQLAPFADNSVDEILSVHVVEHFWRWEVRDILREWVRVLKPGGKMILECPNLESACRHFLDNTALHSREDAHGQRSMWVFYGDPAWKDPYMIHRWGYTPNSLAELMRESGLVDVKQEPAQFKLREPRDMRVTASKPH